MSQPQERGRPRQGGSPVLLVDTRRRGRTVGRSLGLTALGTLVPGAGLVAAGRRRTGVPLLAGSVLVVALLAAVTLRRGLVVTALSVAVSNTWLVLLSLGVGVAAIIWAVSIVATHAATRPSRARALTKGFTAAMCLMVLGPAVAAIQYAAIQRDLVGSMFANPAPTAPSGASAPAAGAGPRPGARATPDPSRSDPWAGTARVNVLLLGSDAGADRTGVRTDSMMVASINPSTGNTVLFGLPRNLERVRFPAGDPLHRVWPHGYDCGSVCLLNAVWTEAYNHRSLFTGESNPGLTATRDAISQTLGLRIDNTAVIDLAGFTSLVDAMGGVTVTVHERIPIGGSHDVSGGIIPGSIKGWIEKGTQHLNGYRALWFSRSRATTDDYSRMRRQRCMVGALLTQANPVALLGKYPQLARVAKTNISVDIPAGDLPAWVVLAQRVKHAKITSLPFTPANINVVHPNFAAIRVLVTSALSASNAPAPLTPKPAFNAAAPATPTAGTPTSGISTSTSPSPGAAAAVLAKQATSARIDAVTNVRTAC